ncbi:MAG: hypothetical protein JW791_03180 [Nanoarchaeota archaeon]|nr:hypothetical protein [Nanoarchaeota archaeon]
MSTVVCEICGKKVAKVKKCTDCDSKFCENCGDEKRELCNYCIEYSEAESLVDDDYED